MKKNITIAIDLTPLRLNGENGGAMIFIIDLIKGIAKIAPHFKFCLLTHGRSHEYLSMLDSENISRLQIIEDKKISASFQIERLINPLPILFKKIFLKAAYFILTSVKKYNGVSLIREINPDLIFCPFTATTYCVDNIPLLSIIYDTQCFEYPFFFNSNDLSYRKSYIRGACKKSTLLIAVSNFSKSSIINFCNVPPSKIKVLYICLADRFKLKDSLQMEGIKKFGLSSRKYLLYPANFWKHKNHKMLFTAFQMACSNHDFDDIILVCTGATYGHFDELQNAVQSLGLRDKVLFPGYVKDSDISLLIENALAVIFPSLYEGFGMPVIEAMAVGIPVACSNVPGLVEVAENGALYFDPKNPHDLSGAIVRITSNEDLRQELIIKGRERAKFFSDSNQMYLKYYKLFYECIALNAAKS
jgi:glycosyltransferase involved in cell wall biosynthesis